MSDIIFSDASSSVGLTPLFVGHEACKSGHSFGPYVRDYYLVHFCIGGQGILKNRYGEYRVRRGQLFVIRPGEITTYTADRHSPWEYVWIAFRGDAASVFDAETSVYTAPGDIEEKLTEYIKSNTTAPEIYLSILFELIYFLFCETQKEQTSDKLRQIKRYINYNYMLPLSVEGLARSYGFERSYLYRLFKARYGVGIKEYIIHVRMRCALQFLEEGCTVNECAHLVGYEDEFNFSRAFKKQYGYPPSHVTTRRMSNE